MQRTGPAERSLYLVECSAPCRPFNVGPLGRPTPSGTSLEVKTIERRTFLLASLAAAPFVLGAPLLAAVATEPKRGAVRVKPGADRFDEPYKLNEGQMECKVSAKDTGGAMAVFEALTVKADRPVKHVHHDQDEWFYVLEGEYAVHVGDEEFRLGPGDSVLAPRKVPHVWGCVSQKAGRIMAVLQPAGTIEAFFRGCPSTSRTGRRRRNSRSSTAPTGCKSSARACRSSDAAA